MTFGRVGVQYGDRGRSLQGVHEDSKNDLD